MADNIYKNSDNYKREIDKLTSTNNEISQSTAKMVNPEKDTNESQTQDKKESTFENGSSDVKSIVFGLFALIGFIIIVYSIFTAVIGEPLASVADTVFIAALIGIEIGHVISGKTKIDIIITPLITILSGSTAGLLIGPSISKFMTWLGTIIMFATEQQPFIMGILVSVIMGILLTLPISSAAIGVILNLNGITAGAATIGCCCQMVGFAVISFKDNGVNGLLAQGLGTSMLQIPNIVKNPRIWIPPTLASAVTGPLATMVFKMKNLPAGSGMGTSGLVGPLLTWQAMIAESSAVYIIRAS